MTVDVIDPVAAEDDAARNELAGLETELALYTRAGDAVRIRIAEITAADLAPIEAAVQELQVKIAATRSRIVLAEYMALGATDTQRHAEFARVQEAASAARDAALATQGGYYCRNVIDHVFNRAIWTWHNSAIKLTAPGPVYSMQQREADHVALFRELRIEMEQLASAPFSQMQDWSEALKTGRPIPL